MKKRTIGPWGIALLLSLLLTGCFFRTVDELYAIPRPSRDYEALQARLGEVVAQGGEYAAPLTGEMIQSVQLQDLDGDGRQEAIAFFRMSSEEKPLKIYIFRQVGEEYETFAVIEGAGAAINCVDYVQMDDEPYKEVVVSWQMTAQVHSLAVYSIGPEQVEELMRTDYDSYKLFDLDQDNQQELIVFRTAAGNVPEAELYDFDGVLSRTSEAPLSVGAYVGADSCADGVSGRPGTGSLCLVVIWGERRHHRRFCRPGWKAGKCDSGSGDRRERRDGPLLYPGCRPGHQWGRGHGAPSAGASGRLPHHR